VYKHHFLLLPLISECLQGPSMRTPLCHYQQKPLHASTRTQGADQIIVISAKHIDAVPAASASLACKVNCWWAGSSAQTQRRCLKPNMDALNSVWNLKPNMDTSTPTQTFRSQCGHFQPNAINANTLSPMQMLSSQHGRQVVRHKFLAPFPPC